MAMMAGMSGLDRRGNIDAALVAWFALSAVSAAYVAWDAFRRNPEMTVMKWGWLLVTLYTGPIGAAVYVLSCQEPRPGSHANFVASLWKQGVGSTIHRMTGDATGIIVGFAVAYPLNVWLVAAGLKHGMGTVRVLGAGGHSASADPALGESGSRHGGRDTVARHGTPARFAAAAATTPQIVAVTVLSLLALAAGLLVATLFGDFSMNDRTPGHGGQGLSHDSRKALETAGCLLRT